MITKRMNELMRNGVKYEMNLIQDKINYGEKRLKELRETNKTFSCDEELENYYKKVDKINLALKKLTSEYREKELLLTDIDLEIYDELV